MKNYIDKKNGISLIVLIVTIVIMAILVGVIILQVNDNNPFTETRQGIFVSNVRSYIDELNIYIAEKVTEATFDTNKGKPDEVNNANVYIDTSKIAASINAEKDEILKYVPEFDVEIYGELIYIENGEFVYYQSLNSIEDTNFKEWIINDVGISQGTK